MELELINEPRKVRRTSIFVDLEDTMITVSKKARIFPVINSRNGRGVGFYITGDIYLGSDTIINTSKGAVGEPIEKLAKEAFIKTDSFDLSNTKPDNVSEKDFRKIEIKAYRFFKKFKGSYSFRDGSYSFSSSQDCSFDKIDELDFLAYLIEPEEFILIKKNQKIIVIAKMEKQLIICDKKKLSYIVVSDEEGVQIFNKKGKAVGVGGASGGIIIGGKSLRDIIRSSIKPFYFRFKGKNGF